MPGEVVSFEDADPGDVSRLGGKGSSLVEMRRLGLPVPPGFIISTDACRAYLRERRLPDGIREDVDGQLSGIERALDRRLGDPESPLLVSVRSGAPVSMPGMMDTILNLGLCDATVGGLARTTGDDAFAWDCYVRLLHAYGMTVRAIPASSLRSITGGADAVRALLDRIEEASGKPFPQEPRIQLDEAIAAVFSSWESPRANKYRRYKGIADDLGTAVIVQAMVFGNRAGASGTGVAFTRDPATGVREPYGDFLANAQGEDVVAGEHDVGSLEDCRALAPAAFGSLTEALAAVERRHRDMCEIEFTIEEGRLWILQSRLGQRTGAAAVRIAVDLIDEGVIDAAEAIRRVHPAAMLRLRDPILDPQAPRDLIGTGVPASPGCAAGRVALAPDRAEDMAARGEDVILVRPFTSPDDVAGMIAARGIVTAHGGRTSHAAVVARGMDRPAVCGVRGLDVSATVARFADVDLEEGDEISLDGSIGQVYRGIVPRVPAQVDPRVETLLASADAGRLIPVWSLEGPSGWADDVFDATGTVLCRTRDDLELALLNLGQGGTVVIAPEDSEGALVAAAAKAATDEGLTLVALVDGSWPASVRRLPRGPWAAVAATDLGAWAARILAATVE